MPFQDYFGTPIAYDPAADDLVSDAVFTVHAVDDVALATPLPVIDPVSGAGIAELRSSSVGVLPDFRVSGDPEQVLIKSGSFVTKLTSVYGAIVQAGLDPSTVASAIAAGTAAPAAAEAAEASAVEALMAKEAAEAVGSTNDGIMAGVAANPGSAFFSELRNRISAERLRAQGIVSVADFGAVADGTPTGGTDNSDAFEAAYAATPVNGTLVVPPGKYRLSRTFRIRKSINFDCDWAGTGAAAQGASVLYFPPGIDGVVIGEAGYFTHGWQMGPFQIISTSVSGATRNSTVGVGLSILNGGKGQLRQPRVSGFGSHGILMQAGAAFGGTGINHLTAIAPTAYNNGGDGIHIEGSDAQKMLIIAPDTVANHGWGINIENASANFILSPHADQQYYGAPGAFRDDGNSNRWEQVYVEGAAPANRFLFDTDSTFAYMSTSQYGRAVPEFASSVVQFRTVVFDNQRGYYSKVNIRGAGVWSVAMQVGALANETLSLGMHHTDGSSKLLFDAHGNNDDVVWHRHLRPNASDKDLGLSWMKWRDGRFSRVVQVGAVATASRPSAATAGAGGVIFDSTLGKLIVSNGTAWTNVDGTAL